MAFYGNDPRPGDNILALLEPGEYVVNRNAARKYKDELEYMNDESAPRYEDGMQMGGNVRGSLLGEYLGLADSIPKVQTGGNISYGGSTSTSPLLTDIFKKMGIQPKQDELERFATYDQSREGVLYEDYAQTVGGAQDIGQAGLAKLGQVAQGMGKGFAGAGMRQSAMEQGRESLMGDFLRQQAAAKSTLFKGVRSEREKYMTDIGQQLSALQEAEGTEAYGTEQLTNPSDSSAPAGWPTSEAYNQWVQAGSNPNSAQAFGWVSQNAGDTPGYKYGSSGNSQVTTTPTQTTTVPTTPDTMYPYQGKQSV